MALRVWLSPPLTFPFPCRRRGDREWHWELTLSTLIPTGKGIRTTDGLSRVLGSPFCDQGR